IPNSGGSLPNDPFSESLGLPTIWIPHSYRSCSQHAPNEHLPLALAREALALMAGLFFGVGGAGAAGGGVFVSAPGGALCGFWGSVFRATLFVFLCFYDRRTFRATPRQTSV